jgi:hypothetical protein
MVPVDMSAFLLAHYCGRAEMARPINLLLEDERPNARSGAKRAQRIEKS